MFSYTYPFDYSRFHLNIFLLEADFDFHNLHFSLVRQSLYAPKKRERNTVLSLFQHQSMAAAQSIRSSRIRR
jgi:hypothetical protein